MKVHIKGYIIQLLHSTGQMWDYEIAEAVMREYHLSGEYGYGNVRLTLTDLFSGGLLKEIDTEVDPRKSFGKEKLLFKFALSDFGRERAQQANLVTSSRG